MRKWHTAHGTYVCVVVAHICKNKTFVPTVVIFKKGGGAKYVPAGTHLGDPPTVPLSPSLCKQNGTKNDKKRACSLLVESLHPNLG